MPKIESANQATEIAVVFLKEYYKIRQRPLSTKLEQEKWVLEVDVGAFFPRVAKVVIDAENGTILDYEVGPTNFPTPPLPPIFPA